MTFLHWYVIVILPLILIGGAFAGDWLNARSLDRERRTRG